MPQLISDFSRRLKTTFGFSHYGLHSISEQLEAPIVVMMSHPSDKISLLSSGMIHGAGTFL